MENKTILILCGHYYPAYKAGGPVKTIQNMVERLGEEFDLKIITSDRDLGDTVPFPDICVGEWQRVGKADVYYMPPEQRSIVGMRKILNGTVYDALYLNSFFDPVFTIFPLVLRRFGLIRHVPVALAPRGEFSKGALRIRMLKKLAYIQISSVLGLCKNIGWHASTGYEANDIRNRYSDVSSIVIAPDLPWVPTANGMPVCEVLGVSNRVGVRDNDSPISATDCEYRKQSGYLRIVFLSRVSPMKNLDYSLRLLANANGNITFDIYGPIDQARDGEYWLDCQTIIDSLPGNVKVTYKGAVMPDQVGAIFADYELFLFPTRGENFGHVVLEAFVNGCPVLLSDRTPWRNLKERGVGWDLPLEDPSAFETVLNDMVNMDFAEHSKLRENARRYGDSVVNDPKILQQNRELFLRLLAGNKS